LPQSKQFWQRRRPQTLMADRRPPLPSWLRPLWLRIVVVVLPAAWAAVEFFHGQPVWGLLFGAAAVWGAYTLIYDPPPDESK
jgi:hypothetical protein